MAIAHRRQIFAARSILNVAPRPLELTGQAGLHLRRRTGTASRSLVLIALVLVPASSAGCSGARHRKVTGPPPEYELPDEPDASVQSSPAWPPVRVPSDAGTR